MPGPCGLVAAAAAAGSVLSAGEGRRGPARLMRGGVAKSMNETNESPKGPF